MRESTSRPSWSVPSGWDFEGASRILRTSGRFGSHGAIQCASNASTTRTTTTTPPISASRFRRNALQNPLTRSPAAPARGHTDPRIDQAVREIGDQVGDEREGGDDDEVTHDDRVVALEDRLDHELPHAGNGEDRLDDHAAADEAGEREAEDRDDREQRVAERVLADHHALRKALGAGGLNVVLAHHLEHRLAHVAREAGEPAEGRDQDRQGEVRDEVPLLPPERQVLPRGRSQARDREPAELDTEEDHEHERQPEVGRGEAHEHEDRRDLVERRVLARRRQHPDRDRQHDDDYQLDDVEEQRDRKPLADLLEHRPRIRRERATEVEPRQPRHPVPVLDVQRLVETIDLPQPLAELGVGLRAALTRLVFDRLARRQVNHQERDEGDSDEERDREDEPPQRVAEHGALFYRGGARSTRLYSDAGS